MMIRLPALLLALLLAGCGSSPLISEKTLSIASKLSTTTGQLAVGAIVLGAIYLIYDPLAPNWEIKEQRLTEDSYRLDMRMKRFHTGGQGEAMQVLRRRAATLQAEGGYRDFEVVEYSEGIESHTLGAQRYAEARLRLIKG